MRVKNIQSWIERFSSKWYGSSAIAVICGALMFFILYGWRVLIPTNIDWLLSSGDLTQHFIGWEFFRHSPWQLPLGSIHNLAYPSGSSVVYMDSIPVAAIFCKILEPLLPTHFQYFGLWGIGSFILQGGLAAIIIRKYCKNPVYIVLGSLIVILAPVFLGRMFGHTALASQWVILLSIALILYRSHYAGTFWKSILIWSGLLALATSIHPYFVPVTAAFLFMYLVLSFSNVWKALAQLGLAFGAVGVTFYLIGGFVTKDVATPDLGMFSADLNALINPMTNSYFLKPLPTTAGGYEGMAYLGLGVLILAVITVGIWLVKLDITKLKEQYRLLRAWAQPRILISSVVVAAMFLLALGPVIYVNGHQTLVIHIPNIVAQSLSIFRATGRFIWVVYYILMLAIVVVFLKMSNQKKAVLGVVMILVACIAIQFVDVTKSEAMKQRFASLSRGYVQSPYQTEAVTSLLRDRRHVVYTDDVINPEAFFELGYIVAQSDMTMNNGYIARKDTLAIVASIRDARNELNAGALRRDTVYVTADQNIATTISAFPEITVVHAGTEWLIATNNL